MKLLYLSNCYAAPGTVNVGAAARHYYHVKALREKGHDVVVITADSSTLGEPAQQKEEVADWVFATKGSSLKGSGIYSRLKYYISNFIDGLNIGRKLKSRPDVVIASMPNILIGLQGWLLSIKWNCHLVLDVRDLWADSLRAGRYGKNRPFVWINERLEAFIYRRANIIYCTTRPQLEEVKRLAPGCQSIEWVPNGIDKELLSDLDECELPGCFRWIRNKWSTVVLFAGKHSDYTNLNVVISAAKLVNDKSVAVVLIGGGYQKQELQKRVDSENIDNVFFMDAVPKAEIYKWLKASDILLINYSDSAEWAKVLPNKLYDYLVVEKPILAAVCAGEITRIIEESGAGISVSPGNPPALAKGMLDLGARLDMSKGKARQYVMDRFDREKIAAKLTALVETL